MSEHGTAASKQREQLLDLLMHHLQPDMRRLLMRELPAAYNAYVGHKVVTVVYASSITATTEAEVVT